MLFVLIATLAMAMPALAGRAVVDQRSGHLIVGATDLAFPAGAVLLELHRTASSGEEGGGMLGPRWHLALEKRVPPAPGGATREVEAGREVYRADGRLVRIEMRNRGAVTLSYGAAGRLTTITGPSGAAIRLVLDPTGRLVRAETTEGAVAEYRYQNGLLSEVRAQGCAPCRYAYDAQRRLSRIDEPASGASAIGYDARHRVTSRRFADGNTESVAYDDARREIRVTDAGGGVTVTTRSADEREQTTLGPSGRRSHIRFDAHGRPVRIAAEGREPVQTAYDPLGRISATGAASRPIRYEYVGDTALVSALVFADGSRHSYAYDANQQLLAIREGAETLLSVAYTDNGLPASIKRRGEPERRYAYRPDGRLASETDSTGRIWEYDYDNRGNCIRERFNGRLTSFEYDAQDRLIATTDPAEAITRYTLDPAGRRTRITDALGGTVQFDYDASGRVSRETDAAGRATRYRYDAAGRVTDIAYPGGATWSFVYGRAGNLLRAANPIGGVTRYDYDASGQLVRMTDPVDRVWTYEYAAPGQVGRIVAPDGRAVDVRYDSQRRRTGWTQDGGNAVELERDAQGRVARIRMPGGLSHTITYDDLGRPVAEETSLGPKMERQFDEAGRVTVLRYASGAQTRYRFDAAGALAEVVEPGGATLTYEYDARGLRSAVRDAQGRLVRYGHDLLGRLTQVTGPGPGSRQFAYSVAGDLEQAQEANGDAVRLAYDASGQLRRVVGPSGAATAFERDALGNPVNVTAPLGAVTRFAYDAAGRLVSEVDPAGGVRSYRYDAAGRRSETRLPDSLSVRHLYDGAGRLTSVDDGVFPVRYAYDPAGRRSRIEYPALRESLDYEYDANGRIARLLLFGGHAIGYGYDAHKRLTAITLPGGQAIRLDYDPAGLLTGVAYPNGVRGAWQRDPAGRLLKVTYTDAAGKVVDGSSYGYDDGGQVALMKPAEGAPSAYRYDPSGQLIEESSGAASVRYAYLPGGDRGRREAGGQATTYRYDAAGRLLQAGAEAFAYDALGNTISRGTSGGTTRYLWDAAGRLQRVVLADGREVRHGYAATGERAWREDGSGRTWFVTDGVNLIADLDALLAVRALYVHAPGVDRPLAAITDSGIRFYHSNALGSITSVTGESGELVAAITYDAFGTPTLARGRSLPRFLHAAREFDADTGLYYVRARYYDPRIGRFVSADPRWPDWSDPLALNRYAYVRNAPTRYVDPTGERAFPTPAEIGTAWELTAAQWNNIQNAAAGLYYRDADAAHPPDPDKLWSFAEDHTASLSSRSTGTVDAFGFDQRRSVKGQELYEAVMQDLERRTRQSASGGRQPRPGPAAQPPPPVSADGHSRSLGRPPAAPSPEQRAAAALATGERPPPYSPPPDSPELHAPTVMSPAPGAAGQGVPGPRASSFAPQSRLSTLDVDGPTAGGLVLGTVGTGLSIATDVENGRDIGRSIKEHALTAVVGAVTVGLPLSYAAAGTSIVAGVAAGGAAVLGPVSAAYGAYRYASAVADRPEREAIARAQQQREVNAALAGQSLAELRELAARERGELQALKSRHDTASAAVSENAAGIRQRAARIERLLADLRKAVDVGAGSAASAPSLTQRLDLLADRVREANARAQSCASEADAARALAVHGQAAELAAAIVRQADAPSAVPPRGAMDVAGLRDRIVGDAGAVVAMQRQLEADWNSLPGMREQFDARRASLIGRIERVRAALPADLTPPQRDLLDELARESRDMRLTPRPTDVSESPPAIQKLAGAAVQAKLDAQDLASRAAAADAGESPRAATEAAATARSLLATADGVPATVQDCRARLAGAAAGPAPAGADSREPTAGTGAQQAGEPASPSGEPAQAPSGGFQAGATQAGPDVDAPGAATTPAVPPGGGFGVGPTTAGRDPAQPLPTGGAPAGGGSQGATPTTSPPAASAPATAPPGAAQTRAVAGQPAAYHIFATGSRMGWAAGLGQYSIGPADASIVEHLQVAGEHLMWANRESYPPVKAWPNWAANRAEIRSWADSLARDPRNPTRRLITLRANSRAATLADELRYQTVGSPQYTATCDAAYMRLGYELGYGQQALGIADEAARNGDRTLAQQARQDGASHLQNAARILAEYERTLHVTGRCADLRDVRAGLDVIFRLDGGDFAARSRAATAAWQLALERIVALRDAPPAPAAPPPVQTPPAPPVPAPGQPATRGQSPDPQELEGTWFECYHRFGPLRPDRPAPAPDPARLARCVEEGQRASEYRPPLLVDYTKQGDRYVGKVANDRTGASVRNPFGGAAFSYPHAAEIFRLARTAPGTYEGEIFDCPGCIPGDRNEGKWMATRIVVEGDVASEYYTWGGWTHLFYWIREPRRHAPPANR